MSEQGRKYDDGKLRYDLIPVLALEETAKVVTKGAEKYDDENWKLVPEGRRRYLAAAMRHIQQWRKGEIYDEEMGTHHIANAISNLMFILEKELQGWKDISEQQDISQEELKDYIGFCVDRNMFDKQQELESKLWYPPVEKGENPWIEYDGSGQPVEDDIFVKTIVVNDRDYNHIEDHSTYKAGEIQWDWQHGCKFNIVAYKIVS